MTNTYLLPVTITFLAVAEGSLFVHAASRRGLGPFWLGLVGTGWILVGKFSIGSPATSYVGVVLLIAADIWNAIPRRNTCPVCVAGSTK
jgi:hypothetical protein